MGRSYIKGRVVDFYPIGGGLATKPVRYLTGIAVFDRDLRLVTSNLRYAELLDVPAGGAAYTFTWDQVTHVPSVSPAS